MGVSPLINAWPAPSPGAPDFGGISEAFNNPLQTIRDDFGTFRLDHIFSEKDTLNAVYTIDDSDDFTPTSTNSYSTDAESLREQVASIEETHIFSPTLLNTARVGIFAGRLFLHRRTDSGHARGEPARFPVGRPDWRAVVGGSAASNPAAQISLAGSNNGSNLRVARNLFTYEDRVSLTKGRHQFSAGVWFQRLRFERKPGAEPIRPGDLHQPANFPARNVATLLYRSHAHSAGLAFVDGRVVCRGCDPPEPESHAHAWDSATSLPPAGTKPTDAHPITRLPTASSPPSRRSATSDFTVNNAKFLPQPRVGLAWSPFGLHEDRGPRRFRHVQRPAGCAGLSHRSERALQSDL